MSDMMGETEASCYSLRLALFVSGRTPLTSSILHQHKLSFIRNLLTHTQLSDLEVLQVVADNSVMGDLPMSLVLPNMSITRVGPQSHVTLNHRK